MNFYKHHLGDYDSATAHLSWTEDMAYTRLLRVYYRRERGFSDTAEACRLVRALAKVERDAVSTVLAEFFNQESDGWHNTRADEEIAAYQAQATTNLRIARERTVHQSSTKRKRTVHESLTNRSPATGDEREPNQEPLTKNQEPEPEKSETAPLSPKGNGEKPPVTKAGMWAIELRRLNVKTTSIHPTMLQLIEDGFELPAMVEALEQARQRKPFPELIPIGYLDPIVRNPPKAAVKSWWASESATLEKGRELGIEARPGEEMDAYRDRIRTHA